MRQLTLMCLIGIIVLTVSPMQADFVQCAGNPCNGTNNADVINGSPLEDDIFGLMGNDIIFGGDGNDYLEVEDGDNFMFGGLGDDFFEGGSGNDVLFAGPDELLGTGQDVDGGLGSDIANVLVGETTTCLAIDLDEGIDTVNLIGFGPYTATEPFGQPGFGDVPGTLYVQLIDPIGGGFILIVVDENSDDGVETINGLLSPDVTIVDTNPNICGPVT